MPLNTKQVVGLGAVIGGLVLLPFAFAGKGDDKQLQENDPMIAQLQKGQGYITSGGKTTQAQPQYSHVQTISNTPNYTQNQTVGSAVNTNYQNGLTQRDVPAQEWQANAQPTTYNNQNQNFASQANCQYYAPAGQVGFYHFKFPEASSSDLVNVNGYKVHRMAADELRRMMTDARNQGANLTIGSAFRSIDYQRGIVNRKTKDGQSNKQIYYVSSHPGFSEHHTGLAIDFTPINHGFAKTEGYRWLKENAYKYGFEQTFTPSYSQATGISQESWHWKYTGTPQAKAMLANGECYQQPKSSWQGVND